VILTSMKVCLDVQYHPTHAIAAAVLFNTWSDVTPTRVSTVHVNDVAPYEPGAFYKRELPCLLAVLETIFEPLELILVDGFVFLDHDQKYGLGGRLYDALGQKIPVCGVAKTAFQHAPALEVWRGESEKPLFVSSIGIEVSQTAACVQVMHGQHRIPTLLKAVDSLARGTFKLQSTV
jgi:deoxyribonuclease V